MEEALICTADRMFFNKSWLDLVPNFEFSIAVIMNHLFCVVEHLGKSFLTLFRQTDEKVHKMVNKFNTTESVLDLKS